MVWARLIRITDLKKAITPKKIGEKFVHAEITTNHK